MDKLTNLGRRDSKATDSKTVPSTSQVQPLLGLESTRIKCRSCSKDINTVTEIKPRGIAYLAGLVICLLGGVCGCCFIPCCIKQCMKVQHKCPVCGAGQGSVNQT